MSECILSCPVLQKHYRYLEAIALEHKDVDEVKDLTEPDLDRIERRAGNLLNEFKELVFPPDYDPEKKPGTKRKVQFVKLTHFEIRCHILFCLCMKLVLRNSTDAILHPSLSVFISHPLSHPLTCFISPSLSSFYPPSLFLPSLSPSLLPTFAFHIVISSIYIPYSAYISPVKIFANSFFFFFSLK